MSAYATDLPPTLGTLLAAGLVSDEIVQRLPSRFRAEAALLAYLNSPQYTPEDVMAIYAQIPADLTEELRLVWQSRASYIQPAERLLALP